MSDIKTQSVTDKEYREIYSNMSKGRLIELLIADKRERRRLRGMWLEQKQANEANKQPDTKALDLNIVVCSYLILNEDNKVVGEKATLKEAKSYVKYNPQLRYEKFEMPDDVACDLDEIL